MNTVGYRRPPHDVPDQQQSRPSPTYTIPLLRPNQRPLQPLTDAQQLHYILTARLQKTNLEEFMTQKCQEVKKEGHRSLTIHDILAILEEDDNHVKVYIEPTGTGLLTDENSADEDDSGLIDNLSGRQLTGNAEAVFHDGRRTNEDNCEPQLSGNDEAVSPDERRTAEDDGAAHSSSPINSYETPKWSLGTYLTPGDCMFPEANYAKYRDFTPSELFELFFDDDMWNMLVDQTTIYATLKGETDFLVTKGEMKVFIGILIVSGIVPVSSRRMFWRNSSVTRNETVYQAMRRRRFEKNMQFINFSDNSKLDTTDKYVKVRPLVRHLTKKFIEHFQPVKSLSHDEAMVEYYVVSVASTVHTNNASSKVRRYSQSEKKNVEADCPKIVQEYNQHMGGTDRQNQNVNKYRIGIRGKKWYWCIFTWLIDVTEQNAWLLHKKSGWGLSQFEFKEHIAQTYLTRIGTPPKGAGRPPSCSTKGDKRVLEDIRFDGLEHYLVETQDNKRRRSAGEGCMFSASLYITIPFTTLHTNGVVEYF
ncbi:piggyBac transposable element-derived protein 3-like [Palaemon carinicauda]|uniref:piggyBac transposable element-derived protein 3-like n=1 Tax=Palaemon carinicauda TaxID=392227 RepID=UPI0035B6A48F